MDWLGDLASRIQEEAALKDRSIVAIAATREAELIVSPRRSKRPQRETVAVDDQLRAAGDHHVST